MTTSETPTQILAIDGGTPVREKSWQGWPIWDEAERDALNRVLESGRWGCDGSETLEFEAEFARATGAKFAFTVTNGTAALETALFAAGLGYGDEVIVPVYTFFATASACLMRGAIPVFADVDAQTFNIDVQDIERRITSRTRAVMPVHIGGNPADMDAINDLARRHHLVVIEDAAQASGAQWNNQHVGTLGDFGCFSFQSSKNLTTGEGGIVLTGNEERADRCAGYRNYGRANKGGAWYEHENLGTNLRMTQFQAAILRAQMAHYEEWAERRNANARYLAEGLAQSGVLTPQRVDKPARSSWAVFMTRYNTHLCGDWPREKFIEAMRAEGIPTHEGYLKPLHQIAGIVSGLRDLQNALHWDAQAAPGCPVAEQLCQRDGVWLVSQSALLGTRDDMDDVLHAIEKIQRAARR